MKWNKKGFWPIDSGVKLFIAFVLGIIPFIINSQISCFFYGMQAACIFFRCQQKMLSVMSFVLLIGSMIWIEIHVV